MAFSKKLNVCSQSEGLSDMPVKHQGFTLIELIITLVIAAIVITVAVPGFQGVIRNNRIAAHTNDFLSALNLARSEAIKQSRRVVLCKRNTNGTACLTTGGWEQGWLVFVDNDNDAVVDGGEQILRVYEPLTGGNTVTGNANVADYISYAQDGVSRLISGAWQAGTITFSLCDAQNNRRTIILSRTGRPQLNTPSC